MAEKKKKKKKKPGLPPGSVVYVGNEQQHEFSIECWAYNKEVLKTRHVELTEFQPEIKEDKTQWINVVGVHQVSKLTNFGKLTDIRPLILEDIANTNQRPKAEDLDDSLFFTLKMLTYNKQDDVVMEEQVSMLLKQNTVYTFQVVPEDVFATIRQRLSKGTGRIRTLQADYLFYALIDMVVDHYYVLMENIGDRIEAMEEEVFNNPKESCLQYIQQNKKNLLTLRKNIYPLREAIHRLLGHDSDLIAKETKIFLSDVYDHLIQIIESIELYREMNSGLRDAYLSSLSHNMNKVMQFLTIISTIFIPLTFIAGIYGMNFEIMPELKWQYGYLSVWISMFLVGLVMIFYFKRKKWL